MELDGGVQRKFRFSEQIHLIFRFEGFNLPNHANFDLPAVSFGSRTFGSISSTLRSRDMQMGLKLIF